MDLSKFDLTFLSSGVLLVFFGFIVNYIRSWPRKIYDAISKRIFLTIEFRDTDECFRWFETWYAKQSLKTRAFVAKSHYKNEVPSVDSKYSINLIPNYGINWLWWRNTLFIITKEELGDDKKYIVVNGNYESGGKEKFKVSILTTNKKILEDFLKDIIPDAASGFGIYFASGYGGWHKVGQKPKRPISSMVGIINDVLQDAQQFFENKEWYQKTGVPWRRGYLLYGPPGNGKSSTVSVLASELGLDVYVLDSTLDDKSLFSMIGSIPNKAIVLLEDVDCLFEQRDRRPDVKMTLSGLLNALDGVAASEGRLLILTTNYYEKLDLALIRPGRCDRQFLYENPTQEEVYQLEDNFGVERGTVKSGPSAAAIQGELLLIKNREYE